MFLKWLNRLNICIIRLDHSISRIEIVLIKQYMSYYKIWINQFSL
jgi:hypothetical protein